MTKESKEGKEIRLICIGDRLDTKERLSSVFVKSTTKDKHKRENWLFFKKRTYWIGHIYKGIEKEDGSMSIYPNERLGEYENEEDIELWNKQDLAANQQRKYIIAKEKVRKNPIKTSELEFLRKYVEGLNMTEKRYFIDYLVQELWITPTRRKK